MIKSNDVFISGGSIASEQEFWELILSSLDIELSSSNTTSTAQSGDLTDETAGGINLGIVNFGKKAILKEGLTTTTANTKYKAISAKQIAIRELLAQAKTLIIDDFHYIERDLQRKIVRALKEPIFDGLRVIIIAVPHRAYDAVKVESEMTGRVVQLMIPIWNHEDLMTIAEKGFSQLNVECPKATIERFIDESFGSPHLMQEFCLRICKINEIVETQSKRHAIKMKIDSYNSFFGDVVNSITSKVAFQRLSSGPRQRTERLQRNFADGTSSDMYVAILRAIAATGPKTEITYEELRNSLKGIIKESFPQAHEITRVLGKMDEIAKTLQGEPVIDFEKDSSKIFISDPFFAFYLRWYNHINAA